MIQWTNMPRLEAWKMPRVVRWVLTLKIDRDFFETHHTDLTTPVVVTSKGLNIEFTNKEEVTIKDVVMMINR